MYITLFSDDFLLGTESNDIITILSPSIESIFPTSDITSTSFVATSLEPTSGTSSKFIIYKGTLISFVN